jgi:hypothetical protein
MMDKTYNGWSNRSTWLVVNWFNPKSLSDVKNAMYQFRKAINKCPDFIRAFIDDDINWDELEDHFNDDDVEE